MHHEGADNYKNSSRYDRKNQPDGAAKNKNPPKSNDGDASELVLRLGDKRSFAYWISHSSNDLPDGASPSLRLSVTTIDMKGDGGYPHGRVL
jgi:hypothetical protein